MESDPGGAQTALRALVSGINKLSESDIERFLSGTPELQGRFFRVILSKDAVSAGASGGITLFELQTDVPGYSGSYVLRYDIGSESIFSQTALRDDFDVMRATRSHGIPAPEAMWLDDGVMGGEPALIMRRAEGLAPNINYLHEGPFATAAPSLRGVMIRDFVALSAKLHRLPLAQLGLRSLQTRGVGEHFLDREIGWTQAELHKRFPEIETADERAELHAEMRSTLDRAADWLRDNAPRHREPAIVHGDYTLANVMFAPDGSVAALLDWELCHEGLPEEDLSYAEFSARGRRRQGAVDFPSLAELREMYEEAAGVAPTDWAYAAVLSSFRITTWAALGTRRLPREHWDFQRTMWERFSEALEDALASASV